MINSKRFVVGIFIIVAVILAFLTFNNSDENLPTTPPISNSLVVPEGVKPEAVVFAALIIKNGDIIGAVEEGLVSPIEVGLAQAAIADGTLQQWIDYAQAN